ncbi:MAG: L-fucose/L-arabinose isomerase family protein [Nitrososphaerota archaeon]|nr:L-fucose/L-arabinose isomerase family protein [Candidatus Bathyarchaeota archaeon]MDW8049426.1 L-fucose/L-arabinose isomerase family protein [Nitrososphaerota archaeon]
MKTTPIGMAILNDEREHVWRANSRECMENVQRWAEIIRNGVKNLDGTSPEVVVGSETITSPKSARKVGEELLRAGCRSIILCYYVWDFPFLVWPFINTIGRNKPILCLSNNSGKYPGNVGLLATDGALRQVGIRTHRIVGDMNDPETRAKVISWVRAAQAYTNIQNEVYGMYGGHSMGMETGYFHLVPIIKTFGVTVSQIDQLLLVKVMETIDEKEVERGLKWFEDLLGDRIRYDGKMLTRETLKTQIRLYLAIKKVNEEKGFDFCGLKGQRELTEYVCLGDVPEMLLNDPYDWNGPKEPTVCATEADSLAAVTMQLLKYVSGGLPVLFMDVRLYHRDKDLWDFCNSGNHASWYASRSMDPKENFKKVTLHPALEYYFKAGGASVEFDAAPGEITFARLGLWDDRLYMLIVLGEAVELPPEERKAINAETNPTWPHVHARLNSSFEEFIKLFPCNHILGVAGNYMQELIYLCEIAGIEPVVLGPEGKNYIQPIWKRV